MIQAPQNNVILKVATKYVSNISSIMKVSALLNGSTVDPVQIVNIVGEVISIPQQIKGRGYEGFSTKDIQVGDTAIYRFDLIYDFKEVKDAEPIYKNRIEFEGKEYWSCDIKKIFGVIRNGEIIMINGYVMITDFDEMKIHLPAYMKKARGSQRSIVMHIGNPKENARMLNVESGDTVFFNPNKTAKYQIKGKHFRIIQQDKILGKLTE